MTRLSGIPASRSYHSCLLVGQNLVIFGGVTAQGSELHDLLSVSIAPVVGRISTHLHERITDDSGNATTGTIMSHLAAEPIDDIASTSQDLLLTEKHPHLEEHMNLVMLRIHESDTPSDFTTQEDNFVQQVHDIDVMLELLPEIEKSRASIEVCYSVPKSSMTIARTAHSYGKKRQVGG